MAVGNRLVQPMVPSLPELPVHLCEPQTAGLVSSANMNSVIIASCTCGGLRDSRLPFLRRDHFCGAKLVVPNLHAEFSTGAALRRLERDSLGRTAEPGWCRLSTQCDACAGVAPASVAVPWLRLERRPSAGALNRPVVASLRR